MAKVYPRCHEAHFFFQVNSAVGIRAGSSKCCVLHLEKMNILDFAVILGSLEPISHQTKKEKEFQKVSKPSDRKKKKEDSLCYVISLYDNIPLNNKSSPRAFPEYIILLSTKQLYARKE
jgi:hypothetical protein